MLPSVAFTELSAVDATATLVFVAEVAWAFDLEATSLASCVST